MPYKFTILSALFVIFLLEVPKPSSGFGLLGGRSGGSNVAEILAAGLITGLLMDSRPMSSRPIMHHLRHTIMGGYSMMPPRPMMYPMMRARVPMMRPYRPPMMNRQRYIMKQAMMRQASHQALTARLNEEIHALQAHESVLEAYLARNHQAATDPAIAELLNEEDTIPTAALLLQSSDLMPTAVDFEKAHALATPGLLTAESERESRYILPRIVKHFVQRILRRREQLP